MDKKRIISKASTFHEIRWAFNKDDLLSILDGLSLQANMLSGEDKISVVMKWDESEKEKMEEIKKLLKEVHDDGDNQAN